MKRRKPESLDYRSLEQRRYLAGNLAVSMTGDVLTIIGDAADNQATLTVVGDRVRVEGTDTTINGGNASIELPYSMSSSRIHLLGGNDELTFNGLNFHRDLNLFTGQGNDRVRFTGVTSRHLHLNTGGGDDIVDIVSLSTRKSAYFYLGGGDDLLAIDQISAGRNFKVYGDAGNDTFVANDTRVGRKFRLDLGNGNDEALFSGETSIGRRAKVFLGAGDDSLAFAPSINNATAQVRSRLTVDAGADNDQVHIDGSTQIRSRSKINGGQGFDAFDDQNDSSRELRVRQFEATNPAALNALIDSVFAKLTAADINAMIINRVNPDDGGGDDGGENGGDGGEETDNSITLEASTTPVAFTEGDTAVPIAANVLVQSPGTPTIARAEVSISDGLGSSDVLSVTTANAITSSFDSITGVLTLTGVASLEDYQTAIRAVRFENASEDPQTQARTIRIAVFADGATESASVEKQLNVTSVNDPIELSLPAQFDTADPVSIPINEELTFTATATDPDDSVTFRLDLTDSGIPSPNQPTIDPITGELVWTPSAAGNFPITIVAENASQQSASQTVNLTVASDTPIEVGTVTRLSGTDLPDFDSPDTGVGLTVAEFSAQTFAGETLTFEADGVSRVFGFFAHWCPGCQAELPEVSDWLSDKTLPGDVEVIAVSVQSRPAADNFPASSWFEREGFPGTTIIDDDGASMLDIFGVTGFPFWVAVDGDGMVVERVSGGLTTQQLDDFTDQLS